MAQKDLEHSKGLAKQVRPQESQMGNTGVSATMPAKNHATFPQQKAAPRKRWRRKLAVRNKKRPVYHALAPRHETFQPPEGPAPTLKNPIRQEAAAKGLMGERGHHEAGSTQLTGDALQKPGADARSPPSTTAFLMPQEMSFMKRQDEMVKEAQGQRVMQEILQKGRAGAQNGDSRSVLLESAMDRQERLAKEAELLAQGQKLGQDNMQKSGAGAQKRTSMPASATPATKKQVKADRQYSNPHANTNNRHPLPGMHSNPYTYANDQQPGLSMSNTAMPANSMEWIQSDYVEVEGWEGAAQAPPRGWN